MGAPLPTAHAPVAGLLSSFVSCLVTARANIPPDSWKHKVGQKGKKLKAERGQVVWADIHQGGM